MSLASFSHACGDGAVTCGRTDFNQVTMSNKNAMAYYGKTWYMGSSGHKYKYGLPSPNGRI